MIFKRAAFITLFIFMAGICNPDRGNAEGSGWKGAGIREGFSAMPGQVYFHRYEAYAEYGLPWEWRNASGWGVSPQLNGSAGVLSGGGDQGFIGSVGPSFVLDKPGFGLELDVGINLCLSNKRHFKEDDLGSTFLFGSYAGVTYRFYRGLGIQYHIQHTSNGHLFYPEGTPNPGFNEHLIGLNLRF